MKPSNTVSLKLRLAAALLGMLCVATAGLRAQAAPTPSATVSPATLAKYDVNKNGVLDPAELAAMQADEAKTRPPVPVVAAAADEDIVQLSPFQVNGESDKGYQATNTMSGTRMNSKIEDVAASLSVFTKQQLIDTASVDINDVFQYETNTEGSQQWSPFTIDRGTVSDDVQSNPYGATRMRGLSAANTAIDGFASSLPFDSYNIDSVEVARGPNSNLFGLGQTGGGVNVNSSRANLQRQISSFTSRIDSYGGYRASFDLNRPILRDRLAVRVLGVNDEKGFLRKPSSDTIRRLQTALTFKPFKNTTLRASFESYRDDYNRPNSTTPRDGITDWIASGKPTYDPITQTVHFGDGRAPITGLTTTALETANLPYGIAPSDTNFTTYPSAYIVNGKIQLYMINGMPTANGTGPTASVSTTAPHLLTSNTYYVRNSTQFPLYTTAGFTNKSLYDWTAVNLAAPNFGRQKGETTNVSFEQIVLNSQRQHLVVQAAYQGERTSSNDRQFLGSYGNAGGKFQVGIDVNERLLDGTPNPYFLTPYLGYPRPGFSHRASRNDDYRGQIAYELDLTRETNWLKWVGHHRVLGYTEYNSVHTMNLGFVDTIGSDEPWMSATGVPASRNSAGYRYYLHYMVGAAGSNGVQYGPPGIQAPPFSTTLRYYNDATKQWLNEPVDFAEYFYANRPNRRLLTNYGGTWQGYFWKDRIIPTYGYRQDYNRTRDANSAINPTAATDGFYILPDPKIYGASDWVHNAGHTTTKGVVVKPLNWLGLLYNESNSFSPGSLAYDIYGQPLNDPKGKTRDYGFQMSLFDGRLSIRATQYETVDSSRGDSTVNTYIQRSLRMDGGPSAPTNYPVTSSDPNLTAWYGNELAAKNPTWTADQVTAQVIKDVGVDPVFISSHYNKTHGDRSQATSRGKEVVLTFNPTRFWTLRGTITQARAFNGLLSEEVQGYIDTRLPIWTTIKGPNSGATWWTTTIGSSTPQTFYTNNVLAPIKLLIATQGKQKPQFREWKFNAFTNYRLAGLTENRYLKNVSVGGGLRWEGKASVGYFGAAPDPDGIVRNYDPNRPIWDKSRYYVDVLASYNFKFFHDKVRTRLQLNVKNLFEAGRLQPVAYNPDGNPYAFRIVDPRQFILQATFDL